MKIFLIYSNTSQYEESNIVLGFKMTEEAAKAEIISLKESYKKAYTFAHETVYPFLREFTAKNPIVYIPQIDIPRWPSGIKQTDITSEMLEERNSIKKKNQEILEKNSLLYAQSRKEEMLALKPLLAPVENEPWFKKWFFVTETSINCHASCLVEGYEFIFEECEEIM